MDYLDGDIAHIDDVTIMQGVKWKIDHGCVAGMETVLGSHLFCQRPSAGKMIGMDMGVYHVANADIGLFRFCDKPGFVAGDYINRNSLAQGAAAQKIG